MDWSTACPDWEERIVNGQSLIPFAPLFPDQAEIGNNILKQLRIVDAPGSPTFGESCGKWVFDFSGAIFGSYDEESGKRLIKEFFLMIPKKNSKSTIAAAITETLLILNWRTSAEMIVIAPTMEIANNCYRPARDMIKHDEELGALLHVQDHIRTITHRKTGAMLKILAADSNTVGGTKSSTVLVEELHLFGKMTQAENMMREATGGLASRPEGCIIYITTQSDQPPAGIFKQKLDYARAVRDGRIVDKCFLPVIYEFPKSMIDKGDHLKPENFHIVNPNYGISVDNEFLEREFTKAKESGEESLRGFLSKFLNVEIGLALLSNRWAGAEYWEQTADETLDLEELIIRSEVIDIGIDGGGLDDLLGLSVVGRCETTGKWLSWSKAWAHPSVMQRNKIEADRLRDFAKTGELVIVDKIGDDVDQVLEIVKRISKAELLDKIGLDPVGIGAILDGLEDIGIDKEKIIGISQGYKLQSPIKTLERRLAERNFSHADQKMMNWCCGNAKVEPKGNAILITKQASGTGKIDPLMALFNAIALMSLNPKSVKTKYQMFVL